MRTTVADYNPLFYVTFRGPNVPHAMGFISFGNEARVNQDWVIHGWPGKVVHHDGRGMPSGYLIKVTVGSSRNQFHRTGCIDYNSLPSVPKKPYAVSFIYFGLQGRINQNRAIPGCSSWKAVYHDCCRVRACDLRTAGKRYGEQEN